jgi:predicted nucleotidyltransferase
MVKFYETPDYLKFFELEGYLSNLLGIKVDLVIKGAIRNPYIKKSIEEDLVYILCG